MTWKSEKWLKELFPGDDRIYAEYHHLPTRELVIVAAAVLDAALAELLSKRLRDFPKEIESFLGVNGDGQAPASTFGARIQLALLIGLVTPDDADILEPEKHLRTPCPSQFSDRAGIGTNKKVAQSMA